MPNWLPYLKFPSFFFFYSPLSKADSVLRITDGLLAFIIKGLWRFFLHAGYKGENMPVYFYVF